MFTFNIKKKRLKKRKLSTDEENEIIHLYNEYSQNINKTFRQIKPEEWVARYSHFIGCGDMRNYSFKNKEFEKWGYSVCELIASDNIDSCRKKYLSFNEFDIINKQIENF